MLLPVKTAFTKHVQRLQFAIKEIDLLRNSTTLRDI